MHQWDRARWRGILYLFSGQLDEPALMALGFSDRGAAQLIFEEWIDRFGRVDKDEQLRIAVITGVNKSYPSRYRVIVGSKLDLANVTDLAKHFVLTARVQQMDPTDSRNLDGFLTRYSRLRRYFLAPAYLPEPPESPAVFYKLCIGKRGLTVRPAWQIAENDPDAFGLAADDDPIVPEGVANPPFVPVLERIRKSGKRFQDFPSR